MKSNNGRKIDFSIHFVQLVCILCCLDFLGYRIYSKGSGLEFGATFGQHLLSHAFRLQTPAFFNVCQLTMLAIVYTFGHFCHFGNSGYLGRFGCVCRLCFFSMLVYFGHWPFAQFLQFCTMFEPFWLASWGDFGNCA